MPRSGGIYTLPPGYFATDGTTIEVSQHNPPFEDVAQALTDSLPRDGSAPMTGNLAMGSNKITNLAAATNAGDAVRLDQLPTFTPTTATLTAGTNAQGQGPITTDQVTITTAAANPSGATLPTAVAGDRVIIANRGANPVNIYPATGAAIGALATNAPVLLAVNQSVEFFARSATQWEGQISQPLDADLTAIAGLASTGLVTRTGAGTVATRQITSTDGSVTITNPAGVAGNVDLSVPITGRAAAWVNFHGVPTSGTYSRTGTLVTVTMTGHGMTTGQIVDLDFTTGTATDGTYTVTVINANSFTVTDAASGSTSGSVSRDTWLRGNYNVSRVERLSTGSYRVNFASALGHAFYAVLMSSKGEDNTVIASNNNPRPTAYSTSTVDTVRVYGANLGSGLTDAENFSVVVFA